jgi:hypothetical protein
VRKRSLKIHFKPILQKADLGILIDQPGFFISIEGCWQQNGINTQSQLEAISKALKDTQGKNNKRPDFLIYGKLCQVDLKHMLDWFML